MTIDEKMVVAFGDRHHERDLLEININDYLLDQ